MKYLLLITFILLISPIFGNPYKTDTIHMYSRHLDEYRDILIFTPNEFSDNDSVDLLFMLDGETGNYWYGIIPENNKKSIVGIGIVNTDRRRDMLPVYSPDKFLAFIKEELIPLLKLRFNVNSKILFGHSFGGSFAIYTMINSPGLFDKYIASSPTPIMSYTDTLKYKTLDNSLKKDIKLFFSNGSKDMRQVRKWNTIFNNNLKSLSFAHIQWKYEILEGKKHKNSAESALIMGLDF